MNVCGLCGHRSLGQYELIFFKGTAAENHFGGQTKR